MAVNRKVFFFMKALLTKVSWIDVCPVFVKEGPGTLISPKEQIKQENKYLKNKKQNLVC